MAEDQFQSSGGGNWWDSAGRNNNNNMRYETSGGGGASQSSSSNFASWQQQQDVGVGAEQHMKQITRTSMDSSGAGGAGGGGASSLVFHHHDPHKLHPPDSATSSDPNLHMMGLGLSSPSSLDWDQPSLLRGEKGGENSFRSMLQENLGSSRTNFHQDHHLEQVQWRNPSSTTTNNNNRGFSLDQNQFSPQYSSGDSTITSQQALHHHPSSISSSPFHNIDSSALYGSPSSILMQGLLGPDQSNTNLPFPSMSYGLSSNSGGSDLVPSNSWPISNKSPLQFLRGSAPPNNNNNNNNQLHFTNNAPFWNASEASTTIKDVRSTTFFPSLQSPFSTTPNFDVQSKNMSEMRDSGASVVKKSGSEQTPKRPRNETPSPLPAFKVRKEKMGDRITALQQLVSPFGKTDTASVLSEAIEYIKFLHEQVTVLSTPYMKSGAPIPIQQSSGKSKEGEGPKQDLRSRGLCLVPVSSTFPVTHESTVDFWTPTFGGGSR